MTDRERKSLVVRRLEQLFTGRDYIADTLKTPFVRPGDMNLSAKPESFL
ncbi:hypothetical protein FGSG_13469 [Fusarium graminearum PH-1]|nr:hypothetical protein FGSG_13469 [Fusarium graminearum PH-1]ESU15432.1 hypothetical protein FGSG_13469 [Fusarium graminearum PH-1]|eukprot:XP_011320857.1 hypothetical protein FGSG_13469 [Fusarium graminearum PH-1]